MSDSPRRVLGPRALVEGKMYHEYLAEQDRKLKTLREERMKAAKQAIADRKAAGINIRISKKKRSPKFI